ncbi:MAG TPA: sigma-54 dependent transcriptional regulator [Nitrospirota bacterium]|nr:sigma-54 dependent transcriptional regulator [Nitrospirota bacterium]
MKKPTVMIVDDEKNFAESLQLAIEDAFTVVLVSSLRMARDVIKDSMPDAILLDVYLPDGEGIEVLRELKKNPRMPIVIVMTAFATIENAILALKEGAVDYVTKPLDIDKLKRELGVYLENRSLQKKISNLDREIKRIVPPFVTSGKGSMKAIVERVPAVAHLPIPVLIQGETGTGKEKLAQWIHGLSDLQGELVTISCAAVPKDIFESELFGYVKGAFSGAVGNKEGLIERAEEGTLFLDEIGELADETQAKLLRVLESGRYFKLGDVRERNARFRLITATHKNLSNPANRFRQDLYYRITGIVLELPRLRDRKEDIPLLTRAFLNEAGYAYNKSVRDISDGASEMLLNYDWPGNIRELKWCIHRAVATTTKDILNEDDLVLGPGSMKNSCVNDNQVLTVALKDAVEEVEKKCIKNAMTAARNNKTEAAKILGISVRQLHYKLNQYSL